MLKLFIKQKLKILYAAIFLVLMLLCFGSSRVYASVGYIDKDAYNVYWQEQASCKFWTYRTKALWVDKTYCYLRICDNEGNLINNMTRLEASFVVDGKEMNVQGDLEYLKTNISVNKETGRLLTFDNLSDITWYGLKSHEECANKFDDYEECNYVWAWNNNYVDEFVYLYVWYIDAMTGEEVAASFLEDGAHPLYDENGKLLGIYNSDNELMENYTLNSNGIPSLNNNGVLVPMIEANEQMVDEVVDDMDIFEAVGKIFSDINGDGQETFIDKILALLSTLTTVIVVVAVVYGVGKICSLGSAYFKSKR